MISRRKLAALIGIPVLTIGFGGIVLEAVIEVSRGHGAETYDNVYMMHLHWIDVVSFCSALLLAGAVALVLRLWQTREDPAIRKLQRETNESEK